MFRLCEIPGHSPGELHFHLFRMPVRIHPFFWIYSLFMASNRGTCKAMRLFGERAEIVLYPWRGLALPMLVRQLKPAASILEYLSQKSITQQRWQIQVPYVLP